MITVNDLSFSYPDQDGPVLRQITAEIREGEHVALIGPNGSGKTTLIKHLNGLFAPGGGEIVVDGMDTREHRHLAEIRRRVGMVFQNPDNQIVGMTVEEDVAFGPANLGLPSAEIRRRVDGSLVAVGMEAFAKRPPHTLSGGEKRLVSIAGVLAMEPSYIAFDEPTAYLDPCGRERVLGVIRRLHRGGIAVIHITHDVNEIAGVDRLLVLDQGAIVLEGPPREVFSRIGGERDIGIRVPQITLLMRRLKEGGWDLNGDIWTVDEACREIFRRTGPPREAAVRPDSSEGGLHGG